MRTVCDIRLKRILGILSAVQTEVVGDVDDLADRFGVTRRTIFRDLSTLSEAGAPCMYNKEEKRYALPEPTLHTLERLSHTEAFNLLLMFRIAAGHPAITNKNAARDAIQKVKQLVPSDICQDIDALLGCRTFRHPVEVSANPHLFDRLFFAITHRHQILIRIDNPGHPPEQDISGGKATAGKQSVETPSCADRLHPYHLLYDGDRWVLIALSRTTDRINSYPLSTLQGCEVLELKYTAAETPPVDELELHDLRHSA